MDLIAMVVALAALLLLGMPLAFSMIASVIVYFLLSDIPQELAVQGIMGQLGNFPLLAIPFFVLAGSAMAHGGIAERILGFADALIGHVRGGLAQVNVFNSVIMGGMSGSSNADAALDARIVAPVMARRGYPMAFASAITASSSVIATILPPSIALILYGLLAQVSVGRLFIAGILPALLIAAALSIAVAIIARRRGYGIKGTRPRLKTIWRTFLGAIWGLLMPVLLLVGLRLGVFTPTELGAIVALYAFAVGIFAHKKINLATVRTILVESTLVTAVIMLIIVCAGALNFIVTIERIPQLLFASLTGLPGGPVLVMTVIVIAVLLVGMVIESTGLLIILTPILVPVAASLGMDPIQFGVAFVLLITIGAMTPPVGTVLYTVCSITGTPVGAYTKALLPFLGAMIAVLAALLLIPEISLWLPSLFYS